MSGSVRKRITVLFVLMVALVCIPLSELIAFAGFTGGTWTAGNNVSLTSGTGIDWAVDSTNYGVSGEARGTLYQPSAGCGSSETKSQATNAGLTLTCNAEGMLTFDYVYVVMGGSGSNTSTLTTTLAGAAVSELTASSTGGSSDYSTAAKVERSGTYSANVKSGDVLSFSLVGSKEADGGGVDAPGYVSLQLTNVTITTRDAVTITFQPVAHATYDVTVGEVKTTVSKEAVELSSYTDEGFLVSYTADSGYYLVNWQHTDSSNGVTSMNTTAEGKLLPKTSGKIQPVFVSDGNGIKPFAVGAIEYWTWESAMTAAVNGTNKTVVLNDNYTLPAAGAANILTDNLLTDAGGTYVTFTKDSKNNITAVTYKVPAGITFLVPYDDSHTGLKDDKYPHVVDGVGYPLQAANWPKPYEKGTLTVGANTTVYSQGTVIVNGHQLATDQYDTSSACGTHGRIHLAEESAKIQIASGTLYCYGFITGDGMVEVSSGATVYELLQMMDWRGFTAALSWMGNDIDPDTIDSKLVRSLLSFLGDTKSKQQLNRSFIFSQYYVQNIEADLSFAVGAKENIVIAMHTKEDTPQYIIPYITSASDSSAKGFFRLGGTGNLLRQYDPDTDRTEYIVNCDLQSGSIELTFGITLLSIPLSATVNTQYNIFAINSNMGFVVKSGKTFTISHDFKLLPEAYIDVEEGGHLVIDGGKLFLYDLKDWTDGSYIHAGEDLHQVHYVASRDNGTPATRTLKKSANINVDGTLTVETDGYLYTTVGYVKNDYIGDGVSVSADKVLTGSGTFVNKNVRYLASGEDYTNKNYPGKLDEFRQNIRTKTNSKGEQVVANWITPFYMKTVPVVGKLTGSNTAYDSFGTGTYYGFGKTAENDHSFGTAYDDYWYQHEITYQDNRSDTKTVKHIVGHTDTASYNVEPGTVLAASISPAENGASVTKNGGALSVNCVNGVEKYTVSIDYAKVAQVIGSSVKDCYSLTEASDNWDKGEYILMLESVDGGTVKDGVVIDLNGKNLTNVGASGKLYGMDKTTDGYGAGSGKLTVVSGAPEAYTTQDTNDIGYTYMRCGDAANGYTFNRFDVTVTDYYLEVNNGGGAKVGFAALFRGNSNVLGQLSTMGIAINGAEQSGGKPAASGAKIFCVMDAEEYGDYSAVGLLKFADNTVWKSREAKMPNNFLQELANYKAKYADENAKRIIDAFVAAAGVTLPAAMN